MTVAASHPQQSPSEDFLDVVRALARLAARVDHDIQEALDRKSTALLTARQAADVARCLTISQFRWLVDEGVLPNATVANKRWQLGTLKVALDSVFPEEKSTNREIYFVQFGDFIKIGCSSNFKGRLQTLQTASPAKLELIYKIRGSTRREKFIHSKFAHLRQQGEWFRRTPGLMAYIIWLKMNHTT